MKNQELNLVELLKDCPKGTKFYSPMFGYVFLSAVKTNKIEITIQDDDNAKITTSIKANGYFNSNFSDDECMLFPSKDQRDWNVWKAEQKEEHQYRVGDYVIDNRDNALYHITELTSKDEVMIGSLTMVSFFQISKKHLTKVDKFDPKWLKPFDKVLCRHLDKDKWKAHFFSHINTDDREYPFYATFSFRYCIPYNSETKHLVGTTEKAPEFYINWKEE